MQFWFEISEWFLLATFYSTKFTSQAYFVHDCWGNIKYFQDVLAHPFFYLSHFEIVVSSDILVESRMYPLGTGFVEVRLWVLISPWMFWFWFSRQYTEVVLLSSLADEVLLGPLPLSLGGAHKKTCKSLKKENEELIINSFPTCPTFLIEILIKSSKKHYFLLMSLKMYRWHIGNFLGKYKSLYLRLVESRKRPKFWIKYQAVSLQLFSKRLWVQVVELVSSSTLSRNCFRAQRADSQFFFRNQDNLDIKIQ